MVSSIATPNPDRAEAEASVCAQMAEECSARIASLHTQREKIDTDIITQEALLAELRKRLHPRARKTPRNKAVSELIVSNDFGVFGAGVTSDDSIAVATWKVLNNARGQRIRARKIAVILTHAGIKTTSNRGMTIQVSAAVSRFKNKGIRHIKRGVYMLPAETNGALPHE